MLQALNKNIFVESPQNEGMDKKRLLELPERIIQFGNGVLLRGLPDYYVNNANILGEFEGRIVVVKSTNHGEIETFKDQNYLYTHITQGISKNKDIHSAVINASISRILKASDQWNEILKCAENKNINIVFSNTTEKGIVFEEEKINTPHSPHSFPGKLLSYLFRRYETFGDTPESEMIIIPTELLENNGDLLQSVLEELISYNHLSKDFTEWFANRVTICNSLVDRIVPGKPERPAMRDFQEELNYKDEYLIVSEPYNLWAIQGDQKIASILTFAKSNPGIIISESIENYKEFKLRFLNASHTFSCGIALKMGLTDVSTSMHHQEFYEIIMNLATEIKNACLFDVADSEKEKYWNDVVQRFKNPKIKHLWSSIISNFTQKFNIRCVPLMIQYYNQHGRFPKTMILGLCAYFETAIPSSIENGAYINESFGTKLVLNDPHSEKLYQLSQELNLAEVMELYIREFFFAQSPSHLIEDIIEAVHTEIKSYMTSH